MYIWLYGRRQKGRNQFCPEIRCASSFYADSCLYRNEPYVYVYIYTCTFCARIRVRLRILFQIPSNLLSLGNRLIQIFGQKSKISKNKIDTWVHIKTSVRAKSSILEVIIYIYIFRGYRIQTLFLRGGLAFFISIILQGEETYLRPFPPLRNTLTVNIKLIQSYSIISKMRYRYIRYR